MRDAVGRYKFVREASFLTVAGVYLTPFTDTCRVKGWYEGVSRKYGGRMVEGEGKERGGGREGGFTQRDTAVHSKGFYTYYQ